MADNETRLPGERIVRTRAVMRSFPGHEDCAACPHPAFESYYEDSGEPVTREFREQTAEFMDRNDDLLRRLADG